MDAAQDQLAASDKHADWQADEYAWDPYRLTPIARRSATAEGSSGHAGPASSTGAGDIAPDSPARSSGGASPLLRVSHHKSAKLPRGPLTCQVEGCGKDLLAEKSYYQRYRVCKKHLKLLCLMVDGQPSRFCQQCGRFHPLTDFDGNKRSCRTRLKQHNARRRKCKCASRPVLTEPPPELIISPGNSAKALESGFVQVVNTLKDQDMDMPQFPALRRPSLCDNGGHLDSDLHMSHSLPSGLQQAFTMPPTLGSSNFPLSQEEQQQWQQQQQQQQQQLFPTWDVSLHSRLFSDGSLLAASSCPSLALTDPGPFLGHNGASMMDLSGRSMPQDLDFGMKPSWARVPNPGGWTSSIEQEGLTELGGHAAPGSMPSLPQPRFGSGQGLGLNGLGAGGGGGGLGPDTTVPEPYGSCAWQMDAAPAAEALIAEDQAGAWGKWAVGQGPSSGPTSSDAVMGGSGIMGGVTPAGGGWVGMQGGYAEQGAGAGHGASMGASGPGSLDGLWGRGASMGASGPGSFDGSWGREASMGAGGPGSFDGSWGREASMGAVGPGSFDGPWGGSNLGLRGMDAQGGWGSGYQAGDPGASAGGGWGTGRGQAGDSPQSLAGGFGWPPLGAAPGPSAPLGFSGQASQHASLASDLMAAAPGMSSMDIARALVAGGTTPPPYTPSEAIARVSLKVANCSPDKLPHDLFSKLQNLLATVNASLIQGFMRPGCTHLVFDVALHGRRRAAHGHGHGRGDHQRRGVSEAGAGAAGGAAAAADRVELPRGAEELDPEALAAVLGPELLACCSVLVQRDGLASWHGAARGAERCRLAAPPVPAPAPASPGGRAPVHQRLLLRVTPAAAIQPSGTAVLYAAGAGLLEPGSRILLRMQGGYLPVAATAVADAATDAAAVALLAEFAAGAPGVAGEACTSGPAPGAGALQVVRLTVGWVPNPGLAMLEVQSPCGTHLSNWQPVLFLADQGQAADATLLEGALRRGAAWGASAGREAAWALILDLGRVLDDRHSVGWYRRGLGDVNRVGGGAGAAYVGGLWVEAPPGGVNGDGPLGVGALQHVAGKAACLGGLMQAAGLVHLAALVSELKTYLRSELKAYLRSETQDRSTPCDLVIGDIGGRARAPGAGLQLPPHDARAVVRGRGDRQQAQGCGGVARSGRPNCKQANGGILGVRQGNQHGTFWYFTVQFVSHEC